MASWTHRKSRKQFRREAQPLAPNADTAGKTTSTFRRVLLAQFPPRETLVGRTIRRNGFYDASVYWMWPQQFRRVIIAPPRNEQDLRGAVRRRDAKPPQWIEYTQDVSGTYRVAGVVSYELYVGSDAEPDFTGAADATSATLPFSHALAAPGAGETDYRATVIYENEYGLKSLNRYSRSFVIDDAGDQVTPDPTGPEDVSLRDGDELAVIVTATYRPDADGDNAADTWLVYATDTGADPVPGVDEPTEVAMRESTLTEYLNYSLGPYAAGADVRVIVRVMRSADDVTDGNTDVVQHDVTTVPASPGHTGAFGAGQFEYR